MADSYGMIHGSAKGNKKALRTLAVAGISGGAYLSASNYFFDRYTFQSAPQPGQPAAPVSKYVELYRAAAQIALAILIAKALYKKSKPAAIGIALAGAAGAGLRVLKYANFDGTLAGWFPTWTSQHPVITAPPTSTSSTLVNAAWSATGNYGVGQVVNYGGNAWRALAPVVGVPPGGDPAQWAQQGAAGALRGLPAGGGVQQIAFDDGRRQQVPRPRQ